jgi:hypothetical protein
MVLIDNEHDFIEQWWKKEESNEYNNLLSILMLSNAYLLYCVKKWQKCRAGAML